MARLKSNIETKLSNKLEIKILSSTEMNLLEPGLSHWNGNGLYLDAEGQIDSQTLMRVLKSTLL